MPEKPHNMFEKPAATDHSRVDEQCSVEDTSPLQKQPGDKSLQIQIMSFGYKAGPIPDANMLFDVRFLQNPFWVEELREKTGLEKPVQDYVLSQKLAQEFVIACMALLERLLPGLAEKGMAKFTVAFGCTGGQHRSVSIAESIGKKMRDLLPNYMIVISHRELDGLNMISEDHSGKPSYEAKA